MSLSLKTAFFTLVLAADRLTDFDIAITDIKPSSKSPKFEDNEKCADHGSQVFPVMTFSCKGGAKKGRYLVIRLKHNRVKRILTLCEVVIKFSGATGKSISK